MGLAIPMLIVLVMGTVDLGRAFYANLPVAGMASNGAQQGAIASTNDIGLAVRQESNIVANTAAAWGNVFTGSVNAACTTTPNASTNAQLCGDPYGCLTSGVNNAFSASSRVACFAVGMCTMDAVNHNGQCTSTPTWQSRPPASAATTSPYTNAALVVKVVYAFTPATPLVGGFFKATGSILYLTQTSVIPEEY